MTTSNLYKSDIKLESVVLFFLSVIGVLAISQSDTTIARPFYAFWFPYLSYLLDFIFIPLWAKKNSGKYDVLFLLIPILNFFLYYLNTYPQATPAPKLLITLNILLFAVTTEDSRLSAYRLIKLFFVVMCALGIIAYLSYNLSLGIPYKMIPYYVDEPGAEYVDYGFAYILDKYGITRLCGLVNEPGYLGTLIGLFLVSDKYRLLKKDNIVLFIAGLCTLSTAFFLITFVYLIIIYLRTPRRLAIFLIFAVPLLYYLLFIGTGNEVIDAMLMGRFNSDIAGTRTSDGFDIAYKHLEESGEIIWGYGNGYLQTHELDSSSYKCVIIEYGIAGFLVMYVPLFIYSLMKAKRIFFALILVFCFFINIYQRPHVFNPAYFLVLFGGIANLQNEASEEKRKIQVVPSK